ncbi:hypothetical protein AX14_006436 [Amanita brunnescens Koide BX004]|nr:hypothetical protein AX14_006436 [Amanita brunnescens Koide BX004]
MFEPVRGGTRGGQAEFKWSDVSEDKDREHYLGHSINAPTGRWQKNKDVHWYSRSRQMTDAEMEEEIRKIKELEANALSAALGFESTPKNTVQTSGAGSDHEEEKEKLKKEERKRKKAERKEQRRAKNAARNVRREKEDNRHHRSRSPRRRSTHDRDWDYRSRRSRRRSPSPSSRVKDS